jgi:hypothetical protein
LVAALILGGLFLQAIGLVVGLVVGLVWERWTFKRSALSSRLTFVWPSTKRRRHDFLRTVGWGLLPGLVGGLVLGLLWGILGGLIFGLVIGGVYGLLLWVVLGLFFGLSETRPVLIASRTPTEARSRSLISALLYVLITSLLFGLVTGLTYALIIVGLKLGPDAALLALLFGPLYGVIFAVLFGMTFGLFLGMNNGGWFVVLQKVAHYRLAGAGNLPSRPYDFLEWGIEKRIFHPVGGGVRFRHNLIQQHLASTSEGGS